MTKDRTKRLWKLMAAILISLAAVFFLRGPEANAQVINTEGNYENPGDCIGTIPTANALTTAMPGW